MRLKKKRRQDELPWGFCMRTSSGSASLSRDTGFQVAFVRVNILLGNGWPSPSGAGVLGAGSAPGRRHLPLGSTGAAWQRHGLLCFPLPSLLELLSLATLHNSALSS